MNYDAVNEQLVLIFYCFIGRVFIFNKRECVPSDNANAMSQ